MRHDHQFIGYFVFKNVKIKHMLTIGAYVDVWLLATELKPSELSALDNFVKRSKELELMPQRTDFIEMQELAPYLRGFARTVSFYVF